MQNKEDVCSEVSLKWGKTSQKASLLISLGTEIINNVRAGEKIPTFTVGAYNRLLEKIEREEEGELV